MEADILLSVQRDIGRETGVSTSNHLTTQVLTDVAIQVGFQHNPDYATNGFRAVA